LKLIVLAIILCGHHCANAGEIVARPLSQEESTRYPWASQITDYMPVGTWRKYGLLVAVAGICILGLGMVVIYVAGLHVHMRNGVPRGIDEWLVVSVSTALMAFGFIVGLLTALTAWRQHARAALTWSVTAMIPGLFWLLVWLTIHH
jgi:hypothetical protein